MVYVAIWQQETEYKVAAEIEFHPAAAVCRAISHSLRAQGYQRRIIRSAALLSTNNRDASLLLKILMA
jgi:hypothetical protein